VSPRVGALNSIICIKNCNLYFEFIFIDVIYLIYYLSIKLINNYYTISKICQY
jgi:hypothetical protein